MIIYALGKETLSEKEFIDYFLFHKDAMDERIEREKYLVQGAVFPRYWVEAIYVQDRGYEIHTVEKEGKRGNPECKHCDSP